MWQVLNHTDPREGALQANPGPAGGGSGFLCPLFSVGDGISCADPREGALQANPGPAGGGAGFLCLSFSVEDGISCADPREGALQANPGPAGGGAGFFMSQAPLRLRAAESPKDMKKPLQLSLKGFACGERGIRTPGPVTVNGFQDRRNRPLCHLSGGKGKEKRNFVKTFFKNLSDRFFQPH